MPLPWTDRHFAFDLPEELFPVVVERLRGTPARIEDKIRRLSPALLTRRDGDAWSIQEHIGHLLDLDELHAGRLDDWDENLVSLTALHPRLNQPMRVIDMAFFIAEHDDHHLTRMTDLARRGQGATL